MDWKTVFGEFTQFAVGTVALLIAVVSGAVTRIATDVRRGDRHKFWSRQLWLDVPALFMMVAIARGIAVYFEFPSDIAGGVGAALGYIGPRMVDTVFSRYVARTSPEDEK